MTCKQCHKEFSHVNPRVKYCSTECRNKNYSKRQAEYGKNWQAAKREKEAKIPAPNKIQCLICKGHYRKVGAHVWMTHGYTCRLYREKFNLEVKRGLLKESERKILRKHVFENGTVNNLKKGKKFWFKKGDKTLGHYDRSPITLERLKTLYKLTKQFDCPRCKDEGLIEITGDGSNFEVDVVGHKYCPNCMGEVY